MAIHAEFEIEVNRRHPVTLNVLPLTLTSSLVRMHSETELCFEDCFWHADLIDIDLSRIPAKVRLVTAPEIVPCLPDPRALTSVKFHDVAEFTIITAENSHLPEGGPRSWPIATADVCENDDGIVVRISSRDAPTIRIVCARYECTLLPLDTRKEMNYNGSCFGGGRRFGDH